MTAQTTTIVSGFVLLIVFVLVAWNLRRRRERSSPGHQDETNGG